MKRTVQFVCVLLLVLAAPVIPAAQEPGDKDTLATRSFVIHHKDPDDVVSLIRPVLSEDSAVLIQSRARRLTVTDLPAVLSQVEDLIAGFDLPPRDVSLTVNLLRASRGEVGNKARFSPGKLPPTLRELTRWLDYELLGGLTLQASEGESSSLLLGEDYRVRFQVATVDDRSERIRLHGFILERRQVDPVKGESFVAIFDTVVNLKSGTPYVFGATRGQDSLRALFLTINAEIAP